MKDIRIATVIFVVATILIAVGLLFLCAAMRQPSRFVLAFALLVIGGGLAFWSGQSLRRIREASPERLGDRIIALAGTSDAEVTQAQVVADLNVSDEAALAALSKLEADGRCYRERREDRTFYVFPELRPGKVVRRCPYCGREYSVKEALHTCPNCGGNLEITRV